MDRAARLRRKITQEIDLDVFDYAATFPGSANLEKLAVTAAPSFFDMAEQYLKQYSDKATRNGYRDALNRTWSPLFDVPVDQITYRHIDDAAQRLNGKSAKFYNNEVIPLRGVFRLAQKRKLIAENPTLELENKSTPKPTPDPFAREEMERIVAYFYKHHGTEYGAYFEFAFFSGMRNPSEIIALTWPYVAGRQAKVTQRRVRAELKPGTKTGGPRDVYLNDRAFAAAEKMRDRHPTFVFFNPNDGTPFISGQVLNDKWRQALGVLGIRHRPMKNTRHTCATLMLENGVNPAVAADQLGHSVKMFFEVYSQWINATAREEELKKMDGSKNVLESVSDEMEGKAKLLKLQ